MSTIQFRRGTNAEASSNNPTLADGEPGWTDEGVFKIGDGVTAWNDLEAVGSGTYPLATDTPTLEELTATSHLASSVSATASHPFFIVPFACTVESLSMSSWDATITASDTDYWTVQLARYRGTTAFPTAAVIAEKSTEATGGEGVNARTDWNFDAVTFDATNKVLQKGDRLAVLFFKTGSPTAWSKPLATVRYEPT